MTSEKDLFSPINIGPYTLPNRIIMAPMTRCRAVEGNVPAAIAVTYYTQRVSAGLIITEGSQVSQQGMGYPATPGIHSDAQVAGWKKITNAVHEKGGHIFIQLWHVGRVSHPDYQGGELPVAPSAIAQPGELATYEGMKAFVTPRALETDEIPGIVEQFHLAAKNALAAGFDGVEIHGANGYLLDQFLRDGTNKRTDQYGGSVENRAQFLLEVTAQVAEVWGADRVGVRLSPSGTFNDMSDSDPEKIFVYVAEQLSKLGLAYLHIVDALEGDIRHGANVVKSTLLREAYKGVLIINGGYDQARGNAAIQSGLADAVAYAQLYLANPDLPERFGAQAELNPADFDTFYVGGEKGYIDYPVM
jgi:N-ethylmaleimide reductase